MEEGERVEEGPGEGGEAQARRCAQQKRATVERWTERCDSTSEWRACCARVAGTEGAQARVGKHTSLLKAAH